MARPSRRASSPLPTPEGDMDLLEYQGKQLFARHGIPVPEGRPATTVDEALDAADAIGYPCVVKAQVQIGGRRQHPERQGAQHKNDKPGHAAATPRIDIP